MSLFCLPVSLVMDVAASAVLLLSAWFSVSGMGSVPESLVSSVLVANDTCKEWIIIVLPAF